jgi:putative transposase
MQNPFRCFNSSPEVIRLAVMMYVRYPLSLRQVEDLVSQRGIDICHETVRFWWNRFGPMFAAEIRNRRIKSRCYSQWRWHVDEVFVRINGETHYLWRAVDHEGEVLEVFATKRRDRKAALKFLKRTMKRYGRPRSPVTDRLRSYRAAIKAPIGRLEAGRAASHRHKVCIIMSRYDHAVPVEVGLKPSILFAYAVQRRRSCPHGRTRLAQRQHLC